MIAVTSANAIPRLGVDFKCCRDVVGDLIGTNCGWQKVAEGFCVCMCLFSLLDRSVIMIYP